jgi:hypothetical protein
MPMRRGHEHFRRIWPVVLAATAVASLGGCGMTPRERFFNARSITFKATPGQPASSTSGLAGDPEGSGLAALGATR